MATIENTNAWVVRHAPNPQAQLRMFCFPYAGGSASIFRTWPDDLPSAVEICAIQTPGREIRITEAPFTHLSPLVEALGQVLRPYLNLPFVFFGHSLGALVSFELARQLRVQGDDVPMHLFVSGFRAPQIPNPEPPIHKLPNPEFIAGLRRFNGTPSQVLQSEELMQLLLPVLRADFAVHETYVYQADEPLACGISAFGGLQDDQASRSDLAAWREQIRGSFVLRMFPGDHFFVHSARVPLLRSIAQDLARLLGRVST